VTTSSATKTRPGGRTARTAEAVFRETLDLFAEGGWSAVNIETVAERAGVHKTTIYRRWPTRGALIAAAFQAQPFQPPEVKQIDTGSLRGDFRKIIDATQRALGQPRVQAILRRLSESAFEPDLSAAINAYWDFSVTEVVDILKRGVARGELPRDAAVEIAAAMYMGAVKLHAVDYGQLPNRRWFVALAEATVRAASI
jgi:AcrR family transcriptional regulator